MSQVTDHPVAAVAAAGGIKTPLLIIGSLMLVNQFGLQSLFQLALPIIIVVVAFKMK